MSRPRNASSTGAPTGALPRAMHRTGRIVSFIGYFIWDFIKSNALVLQEILRLRPRAVPAVIAVPLRGRRPVEVVSLANFINLTPGTLTLEVALDPPTLYVHGMFAGDAAAFVAHLHDLEDRMLAALDPVGTAPVDADEQQSG